jgi:hypothetical protein
MVLIINCTRSSRVTTYTNCSLINQFCAYSNDDWTVEYLICIFFLSHLRIEVQLQFIPQLSESADNQSIEFFGNQTSVTEHMP